MSFSVEKSENSYKIMLGATQSLLSPTTTWLYDHPNQDQRTYLQDSLPEYLFPTPNDVSLIHTRNESVSPETYNPLEMPIANPAVSNVNVYADKTTLKSVIRTINKKELAEYVYKENQERLIFRELPNFTGLNGEDDPWWRSGIHGAQIDSPSVGLTNEMPISKWTQDGSTLHHVYSMTMEKIEGDHFWR
jgi:hypothetical protein